MSFLPIMCVIFAQPHSFTFYIHLLTCTTFSFSSHSLYAHHLHAHAVGLHSITCARLHYTFYTAHIRHRAHSTPSTLKYIRCTFSPKTPSTAFTGGPLHLSPHSHRPPPSSTFRSSTFGAPQLCAHPVTFSRVTFALHSLHSSQPPPSRATTFTHIRRRA